MQLTEDIKNFIKERAVSNPEIEICGLIAFNEKYGLYPIECKNEADTQDSHFLISERQIKQLNITDEIVGFYHSHPKIGSISRYDKFVSEKKKLDCVMYNLKNDSFEIYKPTGFQLPLVGRPNVCGLFDCWDLIVDYYRDTLNIDLKQFDVDYHFYMRESLSFDEKLKLCEQHAIDMGFVRVDYIKPNDLIFMKLFPRSDSPMHFGVVLEGNKILHSPGEESVIENYNDSLRIRTKMIFRHKLMA